jgi:hypothetical protein
MTLSVGLTISRKIYEAVFAVTRERTGIAIDDATCDATCNAAFTPVRTAIQATDPIGGVAVGAVSDEVREATRGDTRMRRIRHETNKEG